MFRNFEGGVIKKQKDTGGNSMLKSINILNNLDMEVIHYVQFI